MIVTRLKLKNWRNFRAIDVPLREVSYLLGPQGLATTPDLSTT